MTSIIDALPQALRQLRESRSMVLAQAEAVTGVHAANLSRYETGKQAPDLRTLEKILVGYGTSFSELAQLLEGGTPRAEQQAESVEDVVIRTLQRLGFSPPENAGEAQKLKLK